MKVINKNLLRRVLFIFIWSFILTNASAKNRITDLDTLKPEIGKRCPDFILSDVEYYKKNSVSFDEFEGKWLILDFWFTGCVNCIKSFPKADSIQKKFSDKLQWLLIGLNSHQMGRDVKELYAKLRKKQKIDLPSAFDSVLNIKWGILQMPYIIIIDPGGVVRFITDGRDMTISKIEDLLNGKNVSFYEPDKFIDFNPSFHFQNLKSSNDSNVILSSTLTKWRGENQYAPFSVEAYVKNLGIPGFKTSMIPLFGLYNYAYLGMYSWIISDPAYSEFYKYPVLSIKDSTPFVFDYLNDVGKGTYNYAIQVDPSKMDYKYVMEIMKTDLNNAFGYKAAIEKRKVPVVKLVAKEGTGNKLKSKGGKFRYQYNGNSSVGFSIRNGSIDRLLSAVTYYLPDPYAVYIDETGIKHNIDISIDALMTEYDDVKKALNQNGLDLVNSEKEMLVVVISD